MPAAPGNLRRQSAHWPARAAIATDASGYLAERLEQLRIQLDLTERLAASGELPDASLTQDGLKITPLDNEVSDAAEALTGKAFALLPHVKITDLLLEVDRWTNFTDTSVI